MKTVPKLFISVPDDRHLDARRQLLKQSIITAVAGHSFDVVGFEPEQFGTGMPLNLESWTVDRAIQLIKRCDGLLVLALARSLAIVTPVGATFAPVSSLPQPLPTPYNHLEGALAISIGLPVLIFYEENMERTGILASGIKSTAIPERADASWVSSPQFLSHMSAWVHQIGERRDVFLGYCSKANSVAIALRTHIEELGHSVIDWTRDFTPAGVTILEEIERACNRCRCAVFLFTKDDELAEDLTGKATFDSVPRDNVLLEAGYFTRSHGKARVAIVREAGAKMPADLGGIIYLSFDDRNQLADLKSRLDTFLKINLAQ